LAAAAIGAQVAGLHDATRKTEQMAILRLIARKLAHDVRNPLTAMRASAQLGQMRTTCERSAELFGRIIAQVDQLTEIVDKSLQTACLQNGDKQVIELNGLLSDIARAWAPEAQSRERRIDLVPAAAPAFVLVRPHLLRQAVINLVRNAMQATSPGGSLQIRAECSPTEIVVAIEDTGGGVPDALSDQLFTAFVSGKENGAGLGLAVTKSIITDHGGRLWFANRPGPGAVFSFALPLCQTEQPAADSSAAAGAQ
jgi:signal transduction histidine kinase